MRRILLATAAGVAASVIATSAGASVIVVGSSMGYDCYVSAKQQASSNEALDSCNNALNSGTLSAHDRLATFVNRGIVRVYRQDYLSAMDDFDRAIALDPTEAESYLNKGSTILRMGGDPQQAIPLLSEALDRKTDRPELAYFSRAIAYEVAGNVQQAYYDYKRAQEAAPDWKEPGNELSRFTVRRASSNY